MHRALVCLIGLCFLCLFCVHDLKWHVDHRSLDQRGGQASGSDFSLDPTIDEIFHSWKLSCIKLESYAFDIQVQETDPTFKQKTFSQVQIKMLMQQDGSCWIRLDELAKPDHPTSTTLIVGSKCYLLSYNDKSIVCFDLSRPMMKTELTDKCWAIIPSAAVLSYR